MTELGPRVGGGGGATRWSLACEILAHKRCYSLQMFNKGLGIRKPPGLLSQGVNLVI
jgi:hypothetical protein